MAVTINKGSLGAIDMTPMIDVIFQLIIFFIVAMKIDTAERELAVTLPTASEAKPLTSKPEEILVTVDKTGRYLVNNDDAKNVQELERILRQAAVNNPGKPIVRIRGDQDAAHKYIVALMNACRKANISDYRIDTQETAQ
jgi:biopolymer transport protein ExbD